MNLVQASPHNGGEISLSAQLDHSISILRVLGGIFSFEF